MSIFNEKIGGSGESRSSSGIPENNIRYSIQIGSDTDIGGCTYKPNQDRKIFIPFVDHDGCLIGIADGHGIKGEVVAEIAEKSMNELIRDKIDMLVESPVAFLEFTFDYIHNEIIKEFANVKCGTTFSLILVLNKKLWIANVGDSTGILCANHPIFKPSHLKFEKDVGIPEKIVVTGDEGIGFSNEPTNLLVLTSETHSPENPEEYVRMRNFKCSEDNPNEAELLCVYDKSGMLKHMCPRVFDLQEDGIPTVRSVDGTFEYYFKNVRKEKGTYVTDRFGDYVLASTRVLGDNGLNLLGVSHKPEIRSLDLVPIFEKLKEQIAISAIKLAEIKLETIGSDSVPVDPKPDPKTICVVLGSDGIWDNWIYDHVQKFVMDPSCLKAIKADKENGAQRVIKSLMIRNQTFSRKNFGNTADNATGIVMYITEESE